MNEVVGNGSLGLCTIVRSKMNEYWLYAAYSPPTFSDSSSLLLATFHFPVEGSRALSMRLTLSRVPGATAEHQNGKNRGQHYKLGEPGGLETFASSFVFSLVEDMNDRVAMKIS